MKHISKDHYITAFASNYEPVTCIDLGERIVIETNDCYCGQFKSTKVLRSQIDSSLINASTGPIYIRGVAPGDVICVQIHKIILDDQGVMLTYPGLGPLGEYIHGQDTKIIPIKEGYAYFSHGISFPVEPMIGVLGVSPSGGEVSCELPGDHGGNMDTNEIKEGSKVYLPIYIEGGLFAIGDLHAAMGDGELSGMAIEIGGRVELSMAKVDAKGVMMPIVETKDEYLIISSEKQFEEASKKGIHYATKLLQNHLKLRFEDAYRLLGAVCDLRISQIVNPLLTVKVAIPKSIIPKLF